MWCTCVSKAMWHTRTSTTSPTPLEQAVGGGDQACPFRVYCGGCFTVLVRFLRVFVIFPLESNLDTCNGTVVSAGGAKLSRTSAALHVALACQIDVVATPTVKEVTAFLVLAATSPNQRRLEMIKAESRRRALTESPFHFNVKVSVRLEASLVSDIFVFECVHPR